MRSNYQTNEEPSPENTARPSAIHNLVSVLASLVLTFLVAELLGLNRFLRGWIEGRYFGAYIATLTLSLAVILGPALTRKSWAIKLNLSNSMWAGLVIGLPCGIIALILSPIFLGKGFGPATGALKHPFYLIVVGALSLGWLYGGLAAVICYLLTHNRRRYLMLLLVIVLLIGVLELGLGGGILGKF
jgi:hypothetical protein